MGTDTENSESEKRQEALRAENHRLQFDVASPLPVHNFDMVTGKDLRTDELWRLEYDNKRLVNQAEKDLRRALGIEVNWRYSEHTGATIPPLEVDERGESTISSQRARIAVFRQDAGHLVEQARQKGVTISLFDSQTGESIPQDSLRALRETTRRQEDDEDLKDVELGLEALRIMKAAKGKL